MAASESQRSEDCAALNANSTAHAQAFAAAVPCARAVNIVVGHYGVGKTNFCLNWACDLASQGKEVTLVDFDVVNPYFRSSDYTEMLQRANIQVIAPNLAGSSLDNPSISGKVGTVITQAYLEEQSGESSASRVVIVDVGGDDAGATVLGRFTTQITSGPYQMCYVVNKYRNLTQEPREALAIMNEIQVKSGLAVTSVVNNSHLRTETNANTVLEAYEYGASCAQEAGVPLLCTTVPKSTFEQINRQFFSVYSNAKIYPVSMLVRTPWE